MQMQSPKLGIDHLPNFVTAQTPAGLRRAMFRNNKRFKAFIVYRDIQFVNGRWFAWFDAPATVEEMTNGD